MVLQALSAAVLAGFAALVAMPASASSFCEIKATNDGFVALRAGPGPETRLLQRMKPGDEILLGQKRQGPWVEVAYWRGGRLVEGGPPEGKGPHRERLDEPLADRTGQLWLS